MCGICGIIHDDPGRPIDAALLGRMNATLLHRGPDDEGSWIGRGAGLAMRRLAIIDVAGAKQPMASEDGRVQAVVNGEIYNFVALRDALRAGGHRFLTQGDAEVLPHLYEEHGVSLPEKLDGMFGLAVWDERERRLLLARDRMGEKPLYWFHAEGMLLFGSELKAILQHPSVERRIDGTSLQHYLTHEYIAAPRTIFEGVQKLEPGQRLSYRNGRVELDSYWEAPGERSGRDVAEEEAAEELISILSNAVRNRLVSDVPLGVFLSGGIDSSSVVAMMARHRPAGQIRTFSIRFDERSFDESAHARAVSRHFGTDHLELPCTAADLLDLMPAVACLLDEPFADASIIPTSALSRFTRRHVTVALGGDGGDELFAGYPTFQAERLAALYRRIPKTLQRGVIERLGRWLPASDENISFDFKVKQFLRGVGFPAPERHVAWMGAFTAAELPGLLAEPLAADPAEDARRHLEQAASASGNGLLHLYQKLYLAEDILTKVDRASMGASLEVRAPFLDHRLVEFASRLPYELKLRGFTLKYLLKRAMGPLLPPRIAGRPKKGFGIPVAKWIKGPLRPLFTELLSAERIRQAGIFRPDAVSRLLSDHLAGRADHRKKLWTLFMFEQWRQRWACRPLQ